MTYEEVDDDIGHDALTANPNWYHILVNEGKLIACLNSVWPAERECHEK